MSAAAAPARLPAAWAPSPIRLAGSDQDAVIRLWHELGEIPASAPEAALAHAMRALAALTGAVNVSWVGTRRMPAPAAGEAADPLGGWRPCAVAHLHDSEMRRRMNAVAMAGVQAQLADPQLEALVRQAGRTRSCLREELVSDAAWAGSWIRREVLVPLGFGDNLVAAHATAPHAEFYLVLERERAGRRFGRRERDLAAFFLRGCAPLHRELLQAHGLLGACQPLSRREREVLRLLLAGGSEKEIARALRLTPATTHQYVAAVLRKFGAHGRVELMAQWLRRLAPAAPPPTDL